MKKSIVLVLVLLNLITFGFAATDGASYCCEKTKGGAWCMNDEESMCDPSYLSTPTSCESTSYCKTGTCYDSTEGLCMENVPQRTCDDDGGTWTEGDIGEVSQCNLGCCIISDQAAFVSLVRCKRLSTLFGVEIDYRTDISSEISCIAEANSQDVGACVYEEDYDRVCEFTTRGDCAADVDVDTLNSSESSVSTDKTFYEGLLCSAEELSTSCARQVDTVCYNGDVYWIDSCGNRENVWSTDTELSWNNGRVLDSDEVCSPNDGGDNNCGNCDYLLGTRCAEKESFGDDSHYCRTNECVDRAGNVRMNGESWCVTDENGNLPGSRYYRQICDDGEVDTEPCAEYRNEICVEDSIDTTGGDFGTAGCVVNRWQDCILQTEQDDCMDDDERDCNWAYAPESLVLGNSSDGYVCVPMYPPGLEFWEEGDASGICGQASAECTVVIETNLFGSEDIVSGADCLEKEWAQSMIQVCVALGDCGASVNYNGVYSDDGYSWIIDGEEEEI
jgi:hypothetical protein